MENFMVISFKFIVLICSCKYHAKIMKNQTTEYIIMKNQTVIMDIILDGGY
jgi:hypothetical protein